MEILNQPDPFGGLFDRDATSTTKSMGDLVDELKKLRADFASRPGRPVLADIHRIIELDMEIFDRTHGFANSTVVEKREPISDFRTSGVDLRKTVGF
jgi:hypothetical protein